MAGEKEEVQCVWYLCICVFVFGICVFVLFVTIISLWSAYICVFGSSLLRTLKRRFTVFGQLKDKALFSKCYNMLCFHINCQISVCRI